MRLGEALALQPEDADCLAQTIRIVRAFSEDGSLGAPKSGYGRTVDLSHSLAVTLDAHERARKQDKLKYGWAELSPWLFATKAGTSVDPANVRRAMLRVLKAAGLPQHFTPHCLRHTYASILLADGVSPVRNMLMTHLLFKDLLLPGMPCIQCMGVNCFLSSAQSGR